MMDPSQVTDAMVKQLRDSVDEQSTAEPYADENMKAKIAAANGSIGMAAYYIWVAKAAALSSLVDIVEGSSSRKNSQAYRNAQAMTEHFAQFVPETTVTDPRRTSRTRAIERA